MSTSAPVKIASMLTLSTDQVVKDVPTDEIAHEIFEWLINN